jgi:tRNA U38,U39,U40 pseudouridine synthase TruA
VFKYAIRLLIHEQRSLLAICLQNPDGEIFMEDKHNMLVGTKNFSLFSLKQNSKQLNIFSHTY